MTLPGVVGEASRKPLLSQPNTRLEVNNFSGLIPKIPAQKLSHSLGSLKNKNLTMSS
jgi:hypothetical protein